MKALLVVATLSVLAFTLAGCGSSSSNISGELKTYTDSTTPITATIGQEFIIALDSNPTTGSSWEEAHDANLLSLVSSEYKPSPKTPPLVGAGGTHYFQFKALKKGTTEITLTYKRPWESEIGKQEVFTVNVK